VNSLTATRGEAVSNSLRVSFSTKQRVTVHRVMRSSPLFYLPALSYHAAPHTVRPHPALHCPTLSSHSISPPYPPLPSVLKPYNRVALSAPKVFLPKVLGYQSDFLQCPYGIVRYSTIHGHWRGSRGYGISGETSKES
jgi:hypothetical protein